MSAKGIFRKKLFKSSFFSFFTNKLSLVILAIIVFFTSAVFTAFMYTKKTFNNSYDEVTATSKLHEYTLKEQYLTTASVDSYLVKNRDNISFDLVLNADNSSPQAHMIAGEGNELLRKNYPDYFKRFTNLKIIKGDTPAEVQDNINKIKSEANPVNYGFNIQQYTKYNVDLTTLNNLGAETYVMATKLDVKDDGVIMSLPELKRAYREVITQLVKASYEDTLREKIYSIEALRKPLNIEEAKSIYVSTGENQFKFVSHYISPMWVNEDNYVNGQIKNDQIKLYEGEGLANGKTPLEVKTEVLKQLSQFKDEASLKSYVANITVSRDDISDENTPRIDDLSKVQASNGVDESFRAVTKVLAELKNDKTILVNDQYGIVTIGDIMSRMARDKESIARWLSFDFTEDQFIRTFFSTYKPKDNSNDLSVEDFKTQVKSIFNTQRVNAMFKDVHDTYWKHMTNAVYSFTEYNSELMDDRGYYVEYKDSSSNTHPAIDTSAFGVVVSPSYAREHNVHPMSKAEFDSLVADTELQKNLLDGNESAIKTKLQSQTEKGQIIWTGTTPWFVQGIGTTADYMYPIISNDYPTPNADKQAVLFLTETGYKRALYNFPNGKDENYLTISIDPSRIITDNPLNKSDSELINTPEKILAELEKIAHDYTSWPKTEKIIQKYNSEDEKTLLAPQRITFLQKIDKVVTTISYVTIALLISLTVFIMTMVVKKQINNRRKQLAILQASGYKKSAIALSMTSLALIVGIVPLVLGYVAGFYGQRLYTSIFVDYWTLPTHYQAFNVVHLVLFTVVPFVVIAIMAFGVSLWELKGRLVDALASGGDSKGKLATKMSVMFSGANAKVKLSAAFFLSNMTRMLMTVFTFAIAMIALVVSINNIGKFQKAQNDTLSSINYSYRTDLISTSVEGGKMSETSLDDLYKNADSLTEYTFDATNPNASHTKPFISVPSKDALETYTTTGSSVDKDHKSFISQDGQYMKNRIIIKSLSDVNLGSNSEWDMIQPQLTDGDKININRQQVKFLNFAAKNTSSKPNFLVAPNANNVNWSIDKANITKTESNGNVTLTSEYKSFIGNTLKAAIDDHKKSIEDFKNGKVKEVENNLPYFISYDSVVVDSDTETYSYLETKMPSISNSENFKIRGIDLDSKYINLSKDAKNALKSFNVTNNTYPIVINRYFAEKYKVANGDTISSRLLNSADRFIDKAKIVQENAAELEKYAQLKDTKLPKPEVKVYQGKEMSFKVVAIENTYDGDRTYTSKEFANQAKANADLQTFDGVFSSNKYSVENNSLAIYTVSGAAPISSKVSYTDYVSPSALAIKSWLKDNNDGTYQTPENQYINGVSKQGLILSINTIYGDKLHQAAVDTINWNESTVYQFKSSLSLSSSVMYLIEGISIFIALLFVALISAMLISDNKKFISSLKVMGYKSKTISKIFMSSFIPALLIAVAISVPVSIIGLMVIKSAIMGFGHVLIPLHLVGWEIAAAAAILFIGFIIIFWMSSRELKHTSLKYAFGD